MIISVRAMLLGQILLNKHWISSGQLEETITQQAEHPKKLGELLLQKRAINEEQLNKALKEQYWRNSGFWVID